MTSKYALPIVVASSIVLAGCFDGSSSSSPVTSQVRVIHASPDAPPVNILVNGEAAVESADFKEAALLTPEVGDYEIAVEGIIPGGNATVIGPADFSFEAGTRYNIVAIGPVNEISPLVFLEDEPDFSSGSDARLLIGHLAPNAPNVDIYVTAAGEGNDLSAEDPLLPDVSYETVTEDPLIVPAGDYRIQVTATGDSDPVFDSGDVTLPAGADLFIGAVQNTGANFSADGASPISLIVVDGAEVSEIYDANQGAGVRVVHASADAPNVDVLVDEALALEDIAFGDVSPEFFLDGYAALPAGETLLEVAATGTTDPVIETVEDLANGQGYSVLAVGLLDNIEGLVEADEVRSIATQASLRIIHASTQAGNVDVYLVPGSQDGIGNSEPTLEDVPFKAVTDYLPVAEGTYNVYITPAGSGTPAITAEAVELSNGQIYTVVARDAGMEPLDELGLILFDDFVSP
ncbi:DUF4397 domain-containing protein [Marinobacter sp. HL-58]|uniref:DUF4397 domain-containing protein n=1 Tax=Marinobacter sp. HL-58 TaxID=1479237 RepID=UPI0004835528|nr:DUF4397 domain-containing protein [Marinobacter sp. HL-58]KPP98067.1 MAG: protein of unknown function containing DUF4397 domain [Marinobacter sp. HL-58]